MTKKENPILKPQKPLNPFVDVEQVKASNKKDNNENEKKTVKRKEPQPLHTDPHKYELLFAFVLHSDNHHDFPNGKPR